jgi:hypothetical protein
MNLSKMDLRQRKNYFWWQRQRVACESEFVHGSMDPEQCFEDWLKANTHIAIYVHRIGEVQRWQS